MSARPLRIVSANSVVRHTRLPHISVGALNANLKSVSWWPVARTDDDLTLFITVDLTAQSLGRVIGVGVQEADNSVTLNVIGEVIPE